MRRFPYTSKFLYQLSLKIPSCSKSVIMLPFTVIYFCSKNPIKLFLGPTWEQPIRLEPCKGLHSGKFHGALRANTIQVTNTGKHSILFNYGKNYCCKMFYSAGPWRSLCQCWHNLNQNLKDLRGFRHSSS